VGCWVMGDGGKEARSMGGETRGLQVVIMGSGKEADLHSGDKESVVQVGKWGQVGGRGQEHCVVGSGML